MCQRQKTLARCSFIGPARFQFPLTSAMSTDLSNVGTNSPDVPVETPVPEAKEEKERPIPVKAPQPDTAAYETAAHGREIEIELLRKKIADLQPQIKARTEERQKCKSLFQDKLKELKAMRDDVKTLLGERIVLEERMLKIETDIEGRKKKLDLMRKSLRHTTTVEIDDEIRQLEDKIAHSSLTLKEEKDVMASIKVLRAGKLQIAAFEQEKHAAVNAKNEHVALEQLYDARKEKNKLLATLKAETNKLNDEVAGYRTKEEKANADLTKLLEIKKEWNDKITILLDTQREARKVFKAAEKAYNDYAEYQAFLRRQKAREEKQAKLEEQKLRQEEHEREEALLDHWAEEKEICLQLLRYVKRFLPTEEIVVQDQPEFDESSRRDLVEDKREARVLTKNGDSLLGFTIAAAKKKGKTEGKTKPEVKKKVVMVHTPDVFTQFDLLDLNAPLDFASIPKSILELEAKLAWLNTSPEKSVKEQLKKDREQRKKDERQSVSSVKKPLPSGAEIPVATIVAVSSGNYRSAALHLDGEKSVEASIAI